MEYALRAMFNFKLIKLCHKVLILVLMEYALREFLNENMLNLVQCLNPCFNGICSARRQN